MPKKHFACRFVSLSEVEISDLVFANAEETQQVCLEEENDK